MARKIVNRKEMRATAEAAEKLAAPKEAKKPAAKAKAPKTSKSKTPKVVRRKAFWGVYNQAGKRVAVFEYSDRKGADKKATELTASQKAPHWVKQDKEDIHE